ncbi:MAG: MBL fold metallo-hydrolase [Zoogloeaceae bacterium]|nr:MBL fold metallo-hydrolase [Zoogloeaceae bacterium]
MSRSSINAACARRQFLKWGIGASAGLGVAVAYPQLAAFAADLEDFIKGPPIPDIAPQRLSEHVWMIYATDGFPTPENQGMMSNITFVITARGVVFLDPGGSLQIGEMALRQVRALTDKPVIAVFNSHYHGDHWLANHALVEAYGPELPIYAHPVSKEQIEGVAGSMWHGLMERWTNQATVGTRIVPPNRTVEHGAEFDFGDVTLKVHHYGTAHTPGDICIEVVEDDLTHVGDVAMDRRIANMDDGSYVGTFKFFDELERNAGSAIWVPGHGKPGDQVLNWNRALFEGIYENCLEAVEEGLGMDVARERVIKDPRVAERANDTLGFESNIGKYVSIAYLEAEAAAF